MQGDTATKSGAVTGWTGGAILNLQDVPIHGIWIRNTLLIEGADSPGDSGAPIQKWPRFFEQVG
jgi:hypothetical protein